MAWFVPSSDKLNRVCNCEMVKEIWDVLGVIHEGTNQLKESKVNLLTHQHKLFKVESDKSLEDMSSHFTQSAKGL